MSGEHLAALLHVALEPGSPPHERGAPIKTGHSLLQLGITPA